MPAMNFPSSPTNGQAYGQYVYDSTKGVWRVLADLIASAIPSPTAPTSAASGDLWFNTNDGVLFMYFNDGNTSQWVEMKSNTASGSTVAARVDALEAKPSGLVAVNPSSIALGSGSGSVGTTGAVTFTGANTISLNDIFSSAYTNYMVNLVITSASVADTNIQARLRLSGVDLTVSYYEGGALQSGGALSAVNNLNQSIWNVGRTHSATEPYSHSSLSMKLFQPALARPTTSYTESISWNNSATVSFRFSGFNTALTAYSGLTLFAASGTFGGTIQVYGMR